MSYSQINKLETESYNKSRQINNLLNVINIYKTQVEKLMKEMDECIKIKRENVNLAKENTTIRDRYRCVICYENCKNIIIEPCLHFICCDKCTDNLANCPVCRSPCESRLLVFGM